MSRNRKARRTSVDIDGKFLPLTFNELESEAFAALSANAAKLYLFLKMTARTAALKLGERRETNVTFDFTYTEARRRGFSSSTFFRAMNYLWSKGFVDVVSRGGLRGNGRSNSRYRLCNYWKSYGKGSGKWCDRHQHELDPFRTTTEPRARDSQW